MSAPWAISTPHALSTEAGVEAFGRGGNAIDAALSAAVSLTVTSPDNCQLGGDLIAIVRDPAGEVTVINASGPAARKIPVDELRREHGTAMPLLGPETVTVPGVIAGWESIWTRGASLPWGEMFSAAIAQAETGVEVGRSVARELRRNQEHLRGDPGVRQLFFPRGQPLDVGDRLVQPRLAETLKQLADEGAGSFYRGELGSTWLITMARAGSNLDADDLAGFLPELGEPLVGSSSGYEVLTAPPNSQGAILIGILNALERRDASLDPLSSSAPYLADLFRIASGARDRYLGDPRVRDVEVERLVNLKLSAAGDSSDIASLRGDTIALVTADGEGWAVSLIQSLFNSFGTGILDPTTGIIAHNRGALFSLDPESPNVLAGGKRPAHTLMPVMIIESGELRMVLGTMGGLTQPQILTHVLQHLRRGADAESALAAPRWLVGGIEADSPQNQVIAEEPVPAEVLRALRDNGWPTTMLPAHDSDTGEAQIILRDGEGKFSAASDPRAEGRGQTSWGENPSVGPG